VHITNADRLTPTKTNTHVHLPRDLFFHDEDEGVVQLGLHCLLVGDEIGGNVAAVKFHALYHLQLVLHRLAILYSRQEHTLSIFSW